MQHFSQPCSFLLQLQGQSTIPRIYQENKEEAQSNDMQWMLGSVLKSQVPQAEMAEGTDSALILVRCCSFHRPWVKGAPLHFQETIRRELHPSLWPWGINRDSSYSPLHTSYFPSQFSWGNTVCSKKTLKNPNVICLAKDSEYLCKRLQFFLRVDTWLAVPVSSNQSLNLDHTTENGNILKAFPVNICVIINNA